MSHGSKKVEILLSYVCVYGTCSHKVQKNDAHDAHAARKSTLTHQLLIFSHLNQNNAKPSRRRYGTHKELCCDTSSLIAMCRQS